MFYCNFLRFSIFPTLLFLFLATLGSQLKADFLLVSGEVAQCDVVSNENNVQQEMIDDIADTVGITNPRISCFKYWLDNRQDDRNFLVFYPQDNGGYNPFVFSNQIRTGGFAPLYARYRESDVYKDETNEELEALLFRSPFKINRAGDIFGDASNLKDNDEITAQDFNNFVRGRGKDFVKLVQFNLTRSLPMDSNETGCDDRALNTVPHWVVPGQEFVDGNWGGNSRKTLAQLVENCHPGKDKISAKLIASVLLPQLFDYEPASSKKSKKDIAGEIAGSNDQSSPPPEENKPLEIDTKSSEQPNPDESETQIDNSEYTDLKKNFNNLKDKNDDLLRVIKDTRDSLEKTQIERDKAKKLLVDQLNVETIFEIFDKFPIKVIGQLPGGGDSQVAPKNNPLFKSCRLSAGKDLLSNALDAYRSDDCFEYKFGIGEIDPEKEYTLKKLEGGEYQVTVPLLPKRVETIASVRTEKLGALTPQTIQGCSVLMTFLENGRVVKTFDPQKDDAGLYPVPDNNWLSDMGMIKKEKISYEGLTVRLDVADGKNQKCVLEKPVEMEITYDKQVQNGKPRAVVDRDGNLKLYNLPINAVEGLSLVVFLDTNVGYPDKNNYAFNKSLKNKKNAEKQKIYFFGFLEGLQDYLKTENNLENIKVFKAINSSNDQQSMDDFESLIDEKNIQDAEIKDLVLNKLDEVKNDFVSGQEGGFSNKRKMIRDLKSNNTPVKFVSFGPSGLKEDQACNGKKRIVVDSEFLILDVWPRKILDDLYYYEKATEEADGLVYQCKEYPNIKGFKVSTSTSDPREISSFVVEYLENFLEE